MHQQMLTRSALLPSLLLAFVAGACSSGVDPTDTGSGSGSTFAILDISVTQGEVWKINRPIDITFSLPYDFSTVSLNTVNILTETGAPALGSFLQVDTRTLRFQPTCPTLSDYSDAGFSPGGLRYRLSVVGVDSGPGATIQALTGESLEQSQAVMFSTPVSQDAIDLFLDPVAGPPAVVIRAEGATLEEASYLELGDDPDNRVYFERDQVTGESNLPPGFEAPINHYSIVENHLALVLEINQPVNPASANISSSRIGLEYAGPNSSWLPIPTDVELVVNCTESGATLRLTPIGLLPQGRIVRAFITPEFEDLVSDRNLITLNTFASMTMAVSTDDLGQAVDDVDEFLESFLVGGDELGSMEDLAGSSANPMANWEEGKLTAAFDFDGTGGPGGDFDWHLPAGTSGSFNNFIFDTTSTVITGGPGGLPTGTQTCINGIVDVRNLYIPATSRMVVVGPNTLTISATGSVIIDGELIVKGSDSPGVQTLNTSNQPEPGAAGNAGGGFGGQASYLTSQSTPAGQTGYGPFQQPGGGGAGGEAGYGTGSSSNRRGAGGGGGVFGPDVFYDGGTGGASVRVQELIGLDAETGFHGGDNALGALSGNPPPAGGATGIGPFIDGDLNNDFLGLMLMDGSGEIVLGELAKVWAGAGGGGGGDSVSSNSFPLDPWSNSGDEKGSGGGGGGGGLLVLALGEIRVSDTGSINADGGTGGGGENTNGFDRVGSASGAGSGGHIILQSSTAVRVEGDPSLGFENVYKDSAAGHDPRPISAVGAEGGAGKGNKGGARQGGAQLPWKCDAITPEYLDGNPPESETCFTANTINGHVDGAGGDGGPGVIQVHVNRASDFIINGFPSDAMGTDDITNWFAPPPVTVLQDKNNPLTADSTFSGRMIPFFGRESSSQSKWIALGGARVNPVIGGAADQVLFFNSGTDPATGEVLRSGESIQRLMPLLGPAAIMDSSATLGQGTVDSWAFDAVADRAANLLAAGTGMLSFDYFGTTHSISVVAGSSTLEDIENSLLAVLATGSLGEGVDVAITGTAPAGTLELTSKLEGAAYLISNITTTLADGSGEDLTIDNTPGGPNNTVAGADGIGMLGSHGLEIALDASELVDTTGDTNASETYLNNDVFERNPDLLKHFTVMVADAADGTSYQFIDIEDANYDDSNDSLVLTLDSGGLAGGSLLDDDGSQVVSVIPNFMGLSTNDIADTYPSTSSITITYDAARISGQGLPNEGDTFSGNNGGVWATDIRNLNQSEWDFFRFRVHFNIMTDVNSNVDVSTPKPSLEFLRMPFRF